MTRLVTVVSPHMKILPMAFSFVVSSLGHSDLNYSIYAGGEEFNKGDVSELFLNECFWYVSQKA